MPQLRESVFGSTHVVPQSSWLPQLGTHFAAWQNSPAAHACPQLPQLEVSVPVSTQAPLQALVPALQALVQAPLTQTSVPVQALPQAPQLAAADFRSAQPLPHCVSPPGQV